MDNQEGKWFRLTGTRFSVFDVQNAKGKRAKNKIEVLSKQHQENFAVSTVLLLGDFTVETIRFIKETFSFYIFFIVM